MKRNVDINEISDGKLYTSEDMVRIGCHDCSGCFACCQGMGTSLVLDPLDVWKIEKNLNLSFEHLLKDAFSLNVIDGIVLPNMRMEGNNERCTFLNENGRCKIHAFRPGICRLFPLGRIYDESGFKYFNQIYECPMGDKTKVKIKKWLGIENLKQYEDYINRWHRLLKDIEKLSETVEDLGELKQLSMIILTMFYMQIQPDQPFYQQFDSQEKRLRSALNI